MLFQGFSEQGVVTLDKFEIFIQLCVREQCVCGKETHFSKLEMCLVKKIKKRKHEEDSTWLHLSHMVALRQNPSLINL